MIGMEGVRAQQIMLDCSRGSDMESLPKAGIHVSCFGRTDSLTVGEGVRGLRIATFLAGRSASPERVDLFLFFPSSTIVVSLSSLLCRNLSLGR
jgi:hypothetical protein